MTKSKINIGNRSSADVIRYEYVTIIKDSGHHLLLKNTRIVKRMATNVISLLQLVEYGWNMTVDVMNGTKIINMQRNDSLFFFTKRKRPNHCFLEANVEGTKFIGSVSTYKNIKINRNIPSWNYNDFHDKLGHLRDVKRRAYTKYLGYKLKGDISTCDSYKLVK